MSVVVASTEIINGKEAPVGKYTFVTGLRFTATGSTACGAVLVAPKILVSAATCASTGWATVAAVGTHFLNGDKDGERIKIVKRTQHPLFNQAAKGDYDFAVFELESESAVAPVKILWNDSDVAVAPGQTSWIRGWGTVKVSGAQSPALLEADVKIWTNSKCQQTFSAYDRNITDAMLCAGGEFKDACRADTGGPLTVEKNGDQFLIGVSSWGLGRPQRVLSYRQGPVVHRAIIAKAYVLVRSESNSPHEKCSA